MDEDITPNFEQRNRIELKSKENTLLDLMIDAANEDNEKDEKKIDKLLLKIKKASNDLKYKKKEAIMKIELKYEMLIEDLQLDIKTLKSGIQERSDRYQQLVNDQDRA